MNELAGRRLTLADIGKSRRAKPPPLPEPSPDLTEWQRKAFCADMAVEPVTRELVHRYPKAFAADPSQRKPLAIGVKALLIGAGFDAAGIKAALRRWCGSPAYLKALARGGSRYGLKGAANGAVTDEERDVARHSLDGMRERSCQNNRAR